MNTRKLAAAMLATILLTTTVLAHDGNQHIKGQVTAITDTSITITTADKTTKTVTFDKDTKFLKSTVASTAKELKVGDKVVVDIHEMNGKTHAMQVRFGATKSKASDQSKHADHNKHEEKKH